MASLSLRVTRFAAAWQRFAHMIWRCVRRHARVLQRNGLFGSRGQRVETGPCFVFHVSQELRENVHKQNVLWCS